MSEAITNTSPLVYLHRVQAIEWLPQLFSAIWTPAAVVEELNEGLEKGYNVPRVSTLTWLRTVDPELPVSEWLSADLGAGELAAIALGLEHPAKILLLDDALARRKAEAAGLVVWGTLKVVLEAKGRGLTERIEPLVDRLAHAGLWFSADVRRRVLVLAGEARRT